MKRFVPLALAGVLVASSASALEYRPGVSVHAGGLALSRSTETVREGDLFGLAALEGRQLLGPGLALEFWAMTAPSIGTAGARTGNSLGLRGGIAWDHVTALVGAYLNLAPDAPSAQLLPSATVLFGNETLRGSIGLFDRFGLAPIRLGVEYLNWGVSYLPGVGVEALGKFPLNDTLALEGRVMAFQLLSYGQLSATVGLHWSPGGAK